MARKGGKGMCPPLLVHHCISNMRKRAAVEPEIRTKYTLPPVV